MTDIQNLIAGIDAGGTTFKCALYREGHGLISKGRVKTTTPHETIEGCLSFFREHVKTLGSIDHLGIATFGPLNVDNQSADYGTIGDGPKHEWRGVNLKQIFERELNVSVAIETDVNAALLSEMTWGAAKDCSSAAYTTIGTGIGSGFFANGGLLGKPFHPEFGHICIKRHSLDQNFKGVCSLHQDCLEGLACAPAIWERYGDPEKLPADHKAWDIISYYLAQACLAQFLTFRPERIILGGGVMLSPYLLFSVHQHFTDLLSGYLDLKIDGIESLIVKAGLGDDAGVLGAVKIAINLSK